MVAKNTTKDGNTYFPGPVIMLRFPTGGGGGSSSSSTVDGGNLAPPHINPIMVITILWGS